MKLPILLPTFLLAIATSFAQPQANQDCIGAVPLCYGRYELPYSFAGTGQVPELDNLFPNTCLLNGENNSAWYRLEFNSRGELVFAIDPYSLNDDYDFGLYDGTGGCNAIISASATEFRCNYAVTVGSSTGLTFDSTQVTAGPNGARFLAPLSVDSGDVLYLMIDNFTVNGLGFSLDLTGTTAGIVNDDSLYVMDGGIIGSRDTIKIELLFNQSLNCNSLSNDYSEFVVTDNKGNTLDIVSVLCDSTQRVVLHALAPSTATITSVEVRYQNGSDGNTVISACNSKELNISSDYYYYTDVIQITTTNAFQLYPNPASSEVTISLPFGAESIEIMDINGSVVERLGAISPAQKTTFNAAYLPQGLYLVRVAHPHGTATQKLQVLH